MSTQSGSTSQYNPSNSRSTWTPEFHRVFVNLCYELVAKGRRPNTHLSKEGWKELIHEFHAKTGHLYTKDQLKNHWDDTKKKWKEWTALVESSGSGYNETGSVTQADDFWAHQLRVHHASAQFRRNALPFATKLDYIFRGTSATGKHQVVPNSGALPFQQSLDNASRTVQGTQQLSDDEDIDSLATIHTSQHLKRKKVSGAMKLGNQLEKLVDCVEARSKRARVSDPTDACSIKECVGLLNETPGVSIGDDLYMSALKIFMKKDNREMFAAVPVEVRVPWLKKQIED